VLILPGFLSNNTTAATSQYSELKESLLARDHPAAEILPANTLDWVPTLSGEHRGALCHVVGHIEWCSRLRVHVHNI
jgi:hypothetical protein